MSSNFDASDFVDTDLQTARKESVSYHKPVARPEPSQPTRREEVDSKLSSIQSELADIARLKELRERELAALAELQRRQNEFRNGKGEMLQHLTRGLELLSEAEFKARRDAEQMSRTLIDFKAALEKVEIQIEEQWPKEEYENELTRALTVLENARMEWNSARLKFPLLDGAMASAKSEMENERKNSDWISKYSFLELTRAGLALSWPLIAAALAVILVLLFKK